MIFQNPCELGSILSLPMQLSLMQYTCNNVCTVKSSFHFCGVSRCCGYTGSTEGSSKGYLSGKEMLCGSARARVCVCVCARAL